MLQRKWPESPRIPQVLGIFAADHMAYDYDRRTQVLPCPCAKEMSNTV